MACDDTHSSNCPPPCCDCISIQILTKSISTTKTKCGHSTYNATTPPKKFLKETDVLTVSCPEEDCGGYSVNEAATREYNPKTCALTSVPHECGGFCFGCTNTFVVTTSSIHTDTETHHVGTSGLEGGGFFCNWNWDFTLENEFTTAMLEDFADELIAACSFEDLDWGQGFNVTYDEEGSPDCGPIVSANSNAVHELPLSELSITKRRIKYKIRVTIPIWCTGDRIYEVTWRERFIPTTPEDEDPVPVYTEFSEIITPLNEATFIETQEYEMAAPVGLGVTSIVGKASKATAFLTMEKTGKQLKKRGFREYTDGSYPPKIYKKETASGSYDGCPIDEVPPKSYSGDQEFFEDVPGDPVSGYENTFSGDVDKASKTWNNDIIEEALDEIEDYISPTTISKINREWITETLCEGSLVLDTQSFALSGEYTTSELKALVDAQANKDWLSVEQWIDEKMAYRFLSDDETYYARQRIRFLLTGEIPVAFVTSQNFTFVYTKRTLNLDDGTFVDADFNVSFTFDPGETMKTTVDWIEIGAPTSNKHVTVFIDPEKQPAHELFTNENGEACIQATEIEP